MSTLSNPLHYTLPDLTIIDSPKPFDFSIWQPDDIYIVLGRANSVEKALITDRVLSDSVKVLKRPSGGESVLLSPGMVVFSIKFTISNKERPSDYFKLINTSLISRLNLLGIGNIAYKGISDLSINNKKILGSSMYLKSNTLFYHAVINVNEDPSLISKYLTHPSKEPDYRGGRPHEEFVTSINKEGYMVNIKDIKSTVKEARLDIMKEIGDYVK